jgi:hypothetical protein
MGILPQVIGIAIGGVILQLLRGFPITLDTQRFSW